MFNDKEKSAQYST